jgi:hypothetical protein
MLHNKKPISLNGFERETSYYRMLLTFVYLIQWLEAEKYVSYRIWLQSAVEKMTNHRVQVNNSPRAIDHDIFSAW